MSHQWVVKLEVWPFQGIGEGGSAEASQKLAGPRERHFDVEAQDVRGALKAAELIVQGIKSSGHVWEAPIMSVERKDRR